MTRNQFKKRRRKLLKEFHPDTGGDHESFIKLKAFLKWVELFIVEKK